MIGGTVAAPFISGCFDAKRAMSRTGFRTPLKAGLALMVALGSGCSSSSPARPSEPDTTTGPNTLTSAERAAGWRLLFDGSTTSGWRGFRQAGIPSGWQVLDGALTQVAGGGDVITTDRFANFELAVEWQIAEGGNSGIMFRVSEVAADLTHLTGPEMQVLDNARAPDPGPLGFAGACYGLYAPSQDVTRPAGSWNAARLIANRSHIEHWLNGVKIVEYEMGSADWLARLQLSPYRDVPTYARESLGHIALQEHGARVAFRNLKLRVIQ
jgi:3-keto-disaccharide hydrolase